MNIHIIDTHNQINRHYHVLKNELSGADLSAATLSRLQRYQQARDADLCIYACDLNVTFRDLLYPDYKGQRTEKDQALKDALHAAHDWLSNSETRSACAPGYEADDVINALVRRATNQGHTVTIHSTDQDLFSLLQHPGVTIRGSGVRTSEHPDLPYPPSHTALLKALKGDSSDNIPGLKGVGTKTAVPAAARYQNAHELINNWLNLSFTLQRALNNQESQLLFWEHLTQLHVPPVTYRVSPSAHAQAPTQAALIAQQWTGWKPEN